MRNSLNVVFAVLATIASYFAILLSTNVAWVLTTPHLTPINAFLKAYNFEIYLAIGMALLGRLLAHLFYGRLFQGRRVNHYVFFRNISVYVCCLLFIISYYYFGMDALLDFDFGMDSYIEPIEFSGSN